MLWECVSVTATYLLTAALSVSAHFNAVLTDTAQLWHAHTLNPTALSSLTLTLVLCSESCIFTFCVEAAESCVHAKHNLSAPQLKV